MIKLDKTIIVEGKYDKIRLANIVDAPIIETGGFRIFKNEEMRRFIRLLAEKKGVIVLTDSDSAGKMIRNHIKNIAPKGEVINVYLPQIPGKEKRKDKAGKEGILGVEGTPDDIIISALQKFAVKPTAVQITKIDFYNLGFTGSAQSKEKRRQLCRILDIPENLSVNEILETVNHIYTRAEFFEEAEKCRETQIKN